MITFDREARLFHIRTSHTSYIMDIVPGGWLRHLYWGERLEHWQGAATIPMMDRSFAPNPADTPSDRRVSLDTLAQEYPAYGNSDMREPAVGVVQPDGSRITDLRFADYHITAGKKALPGLPAVYAGDSDAETLEIELLDTVTGLRVFLSYAVLADSDAIMRSVRFVNGGRKTLTLERALSACIDIGGLQGYELLWLPGAWARERRPERQPLGHCRQVVESRRGASSPQENPFLALLSPHATETKGEIYALSFIYSGSFAGFVEMDQFDVTRVAIGLNPFDFSWELTPGAEFTTPEAVLLYTADGLGAMSRAFHALYREHLMRGSWRDRERPILVNNWEATYFDFDAAKLCQLIDKAAELGIELMVLDDGWFGHRNDDTSSLGDWFEDKQKLPDGLEGVARHAQEKGIHFGLWFEPEMVSEDSELYRAHPDWALGVPGRPRTTGRSQYVLDLSRREVQDYVLAAVADVIRRVHIDYMKWDMNRHMTEVCSHSLPASRQKETAHRYMLGLYRILETLHQEFPTVLFESCSGGGGRFDPGMLYYMPQTWASDDSDAIERLAIQYGTSLVYPPQAMGAHVSAIPNHQTGRQEPLATRAIVAMAGTFGYELDITRFSPEESAEVQAEIALFKELRPLLYRGQLYRLLVPERRGDPFAWLVVAPDRRRAFLSYVQPLALPNPPHRFLRLEGLDGRLSYRVTERITTARQHYPQAPLTWLEHGPLQHGSRIFGGDELMLAGICLPVLMGDYQAFGWELTAVEEE